MSSGCTGIVSFCKCAAVHPLASRSSVGSLGVHDVTLKAPLCGCKAPRTIPRVHWSASIAQAGRSSSL
eukprot:scaffold98764_cov68-Phaeocystis_antarctica.AAC.3